MVRAEGLSKLILHQKWILVWRKKTRIQTLRRIESERSYDIIADRHLQKHIPKRVIRIWKEFVKSRKDERWREFRKDMLRKSVQVHLMN